MGRILKYIIPVIGLIMGFSTHLEAQEKHETPDKQNVNLRALKACADSLVMNYHFEEALSLLKDAKENADSLSSLAIDEMMTDSQNGWSMSGFCSNPTVVAKQRFALKEFFLYYPVEDHSWRLLPNKLDKAVGNRFVNSTYVPEGAREIYWSTADSEGIRNIFRSSLRDTVWTAPELLNEHLTSSSDEIFPMLSPDGKKLYFSSEGLYGMGGYDLYVSTLDETTGEWGVPVNMGFPYSSPYNDFLYFNTPDGKYTMFASDRGCPADSVDIFVLEHDSMPVRIAITDPEELRELCMLEPKDGQGEIYAENSSQIGENEDIRRYASMLLNVRNLRESISAFGRSLDEARAKIASASESEKASLAEIILSKEASLPRLQDSLLTATRELQKIELDFLQSGVIIDPEKLQFESEREIIGSKSGYAFTRKNLGKELYIKILEPKPKFDYTFQILPEGRFALDNTLPDGLVYQIQIFAINGKATIKQIKGLSPVFERKSTSGKNVYSVGLFSSYKDVLGNLNKVKKAGFRDAVIIAFNNGKPVSISKAKEIEKDVPDVLYQVRFSPADGRTLSEVEKNAVKSITSADISKTEEDGIVYFILGPYESKGEADEVAKGLSIAGISEVMTESAYPTPQISHQ